jgi:hypothetical protein
MESEEHDQISIRLSDVQSYLIKQLWKNCSFTSPCCHYVW